ncbi:hypothetical protein COO60DRAFT_1127240 [Scenedesmus sp. NREL 46B-D3]|nr:hypothetical protein COO60DRAFT_1127240 [Scenedesmus sp. NREL 46B-D3]
MCYWQRWGAYRAHAHQPACRSIACTCTLLQMSWGSNSTAWHCTATSSAINLLWSANQGGHAKHADCVIAAVSPMHPVGHRMTHLACSVTFGPSAAGLRACRKLRAGPSTMHMRVWRQGSMQFNWLLLPANSRARTSATGVAGAPAQLLCHTVGHCMQASRNGCCCIT